MKRTEKLLIIAIVVMAFTLAVGFLPIHGEEKIYDTAVRLHVIANSDEEYDQELKMQVRDSVLDVIVPLLENCKSQSEAVDIINENKQVIYSNAKNKVTENGYDYDVSIELTKERYPTRDYGNFVFPSGEYMSLKVIIGEGDGQNFWCCLYPQLCTSLTTEISEEYRDDAFISAGLTGEQYKIITENDDIKYRVRFKILETFEKFFA